MSHLILRVLKTDSRLPKKILCFIESPLKVDEKYFLSHLSSSFRSQDIEVFNTTCWSRRENGLIRHIRLTSKFMTSQPG